MPDETSFAIEISDLSYTYHDESLNQNHSEKRTVLRDITVRVRHGEFVAIIGPNGSGKSTLARLICGLLKPTTGQVVISGLQAAKSINKLEIRKKIGLVQQNPDNQLVAARLEEDIAFGPENLNLTPGEIRRRVEDALTVTKLSNLRDRPPHLLSGGEKQRLAIAGILALNTPCLVLDEPTSMLDPSGRRDVLQLLRSLAQIGITILLVTHLMEEAALADRIWVLDKGKIIADNTPGNIFARRDLLRSLGLEPPQSMQLAHLMVDSGADVDRGQGNDSIVSLEDLVCFLCRILK